MDVWQEIERAGDVVIVLVKTYPIETTYLLLGMNVVMFGYMAIGTFLRVRRGDQGSGRGGRR